jgi:hypothetical protein
MLGPTLGRRVDRPADGRGPKGRRAARQLEGPEAGRTHHFALESDGLIQVFDVWKSQETFEAFGATLLPILAELGVDPGESMVAPIHNIITG